MTEKMVLRWPTYEVAPEDSVYALGVVSINYARFERTHVWMLAAVANMREDQATIIAARTNASERGRLIETFFGRREWPPETAAAIKHYLKAMDVLIQSRNVLIHSNMVRGTESRTAIYSLSKQGRHNLFQATLEEIRAVADGLETYFNFGLGLANYIATEIHHMAREAGMLVVSTVPGLPALPVHIDPSQRPRC
jgi:hypothetical protein